MIKKVLIAQLCPILCDPVDYSPPGSSVHGVLQVRTLMCVAISSSWGSSQPRDQTHISCISRWNFYQWATWEMQYFDNNIFKALRSPGEGNGYPLQYSCLEGCQESDTITGGKNATGHGITSWNNLGTIIAKPILSFFNSEKFLLFILPYIYFYPLLRYLIYRC